MPPPPRLRRLARERPANGPVVDTMHGVEIRPRAEHLVADYMGGGEWRMLHYFVPEGDDTPP